MSALPAKQTDAPVLPSMTRAQASERLTSHPLVRVINYHNTLARDRGRHAAQLAAIAGRVRPLDEDGLEALFDGVPSDDPRPPVIPVLYEGLRNNYDVALELIEGAGLKAWIFPLTGFVGAPVERQRAYADANHIGLTDVDPEPRVAMTWDELRDIVRRGHVVCCHTESHAGIEDCPTPDDVQRELIAPKALLEEQLQIEVKTFAWLWGTHYGESERLDRIVKDAGYRFVFSNTKIQRIASA